MADVKKYLDLAGLRTLWGQVEIHVQNSIAADSADRVEAERVLEEKITAEIARATGVEGELRTEISNEVKARIAAVSELSQEILDEAERAQGVERELRGLVDAINNPDTGILAQAIAHVAEREEVLNGKIDEVETALEEHKVAQTEKDEAQDQALVNTKSALETEDARLAGLITKEVSNREAAITAVQGAIDNEVARAQAAETGLQNAINTLNGGEAVEGSVSQKIKDAVKTINGNIDGVKGRVTALEEEVASIPGSIEAAKAEAKAHAEEKITELVGGAPETMDTLKELAQAIEDHQDVYDAYVETVAGDIAKAKGEAIAEAGKLDNALKTELKGEIKSAVELEANRAKEVETKLTEDLAAEVARATGKESELLAKITSEVEKLSGVDSNLLQAINTEKAAREEAIQSVNNSIGAVGTRVETLENAGYQNAIQVGNAIDSKINGLNLPGTYEVKGAAAEALANAKSYVDGEISRRVVALTDEEIMNIIGK